MTATAENDKTAEACFQSVLDISLCLMKFRASYLSFVKTVLKLQTAYVKFWWTVGYSVKWMFDTSQPVQQIMPVSTLGKHLSIYQLLSSANNNILKANYPAHVAHDACKHLIAFKIYSHFSVSASQIEELRAFLPLLTLSGMKFCIIFTHNGCHSAVDHLLQSWPALTSYFRSLGETCPVALSSAAEMYMFFFHNFDQLIKYLEETNLCIADIYMEVPKFNMKMPQQTQVKFWIPNSAASSQHKRRSSCRTSMILSLHTMTSALISQQKNVKLKPVSFYELSFIDLEQVEPAIKMTVSMDQLLETFCAILG